MTFMFKAHRRYASHVRPQVPLCAQTLEDIMSIESLMRTEQLRDPNVLDAKAQYEMCPALVELVCKALRSSGSKPRACSKRMPLQDMHAPRPQGTKLALGCTGHVPLQHCVHTVCVLQQVGSVGSQCTSRACTRLKCELASGWRPEGDAMQMCASLAVPQFHRSQLHVADPVLPAADPAMQLARVPALALYLDMVRSYSSYPERLASTKGIVLAVGRLALPYCLKELSDWLSRGGMALGASPPCACAARCAWVQSSRRGPASALFEGVVAFMHAGSMPASDRNLQACCSATFAPG